MAMNSYLFFETERLWVRPTTEEDADFIVAVFNTEGALRFIGDRQIRTREDALGFIKNRTLKQLAEVRFANYTVVEKETGAKIGVAGLYKRPGLELVDLGYALLPEYEGQGFAFESANALKEAAFSHFECNALCAITHPENSASARLLDKLGFHKIDQRELPGVDGVSDYYEI